MIKLYYWPIYGRAEPIRMLLKHAGVPFQDVEVTQDSFESLKRQESVEFDCLPMIKLATGECLNMTGAILRMFGTMYGYYETEQPREAWQIDSIIDSVNDVVAKYSAFQSQQAGRGGTQSTEDRETLLALKASYITTDLPNWLKAIEKRLEI